MAVQISESFQLYAHAPLDSRSQFRTVAEMRSFPTSRLYEGIIASVVENTTTYHPEPRKQSYYDLSILFFE